MKIAIIPSNNGLGHIKRCSIIANELCKKNKVHFFAPKQKAKKFSINKKIKIINFDTKINFNSKYFKNNKKWIDFFKKRKDYDIYFSDNLPELAYINKNFYLYANFFWHHLYKKENYSKSKEIDKLLVKRKVVLFSDRIFKSKDISDKLKPIPVDIIGSKVIKKRKNLKKNILFSFGTANYVEKKNILKFLIKENFNLKVNFSKIFVDKYYQKKLKNFNIATYDREMFQNTDFAIVKPGQGIVTDCLKWNIEILTYTKNQNYEFKYNSFVLQKFFGIKNFKSLKSATLDIINRKSKKNVTKNIKKIKFNGEKKIAKFLIKYHNQNETNLPH